MQIVKQKLLLLLTCIIVYSTGFAQSGGPQAALYKISFGHIYRISNATNGKDVEVEDGLFNKGSRVQQWDGYIRNGSADGHGQEWFFIPAGSVTRANGTVTYLVRIINYGFLDYLSTGRGGGQVTLEKLNPAGSNLGTFWEIVRVANSTEIKLRSHSTNQFLQAPADNNNGSAMTVAPEANIASQRFKLTLFSKDGPPHNPDNKPFVLVAAGNRSKALDVTACGVDNNTILQIWNKESNNRCQQFIITDVARGEGNIFRLAPVIVPSFNVRLQDPSAQYAGANIVTGDPSISNIATQWIIVKCIRDAGKYILFNFNGMCMEVWNRRTDAGATIGQNAFYNTDNQKWIIEKVN